MEEILVCKRLVVLILSVFVVGEFASVCCQGMNMSNSSSSSNGTSVVMRKKQHPWIGPIGTRHITVDQNGQGNFLTVQDAVNSIPDGNRMRVIINIHAGLYEEKVIVPEGKPYITFKGAGKDVTMIQWHNRACDLDPTGQQLHTYHSASVSVLANYFTAKNISFRNTAPAPLPGVEGWQAVAFRISGDKALFLGCGFYGAQDTLCDDSGRHYFKECFIQGSIDFIFGNGRSMYKHCELHSMAREFGSIAAQNRAGEDEKTGFAFVHCRVTGSGPLYIGRAMGQHSRIVYAYTYFEDIVASVAWDDWDHNSTKHKTAFFGVYKCYGPGAGNAAAVSWAPELSFQQARPFLVKSFVNGRHWINPADA